MQGDLQGLNGDSEPTCKQKMRPQPTHPVQVSNAHVKMTARDAL